MSQYAVRNLEKYAIEMRAAAATYISNDYTDNLDEFVTVKQLTSFIKSKSVGIDEKGRLLLNSETIDDIFVTVCDWIYGVGLSRLASKNLLECAWDNDQNRMVFWKSEGEVTDELSKQPDNRDKTGD